MASDQIDSVSSDDALDARTVSIVLGFLCSRANRLRNESREAEAEGDEQAAYDAQIQCNAVLEVERDLRGMCR